MRVRKRFDAEKIRRIGWIPGIWAIFFWSPGAAEVAVDFQIFTGTLLRGRSSEFLSRSHGIPFR